MPTVDAVPSTDSSRNIFWTSFIFVLLIPIIGSIFSPLLFAIVVPVAGVGYFIAHKICFGRWPWLNAPLPGLFHLIAILIALLFCSSLWSVMPQATFARAGNVSVLMLGSFALLGVAQACPGGIWRKYSALFPFMALTVGAVTCLDIMTGLNFFNFFHQVAAGELRPDDLNKNISVFVMLLPPVAYLSWKTSSVILSLLVPVLALATFFLTYSQACQLSLLVMAMAAIGCLFFLEKITMRAAFLNLSFLLLMLPWIAPTLFDLWAAKLDAKSGIAASASASLRLENWDFLSRRILENPLNGFGMDSTRYMTFDTQELYFHNNSIMHPHNMFLQMWIEFGMFGVGWTLTFFGYLYALLTRLTPKDRRLAFLTFCGVMVFLLVSWSIWASWLVAFIFYLATLCVLAAKTSNDLSNS